jgi:outer membrane protein insertion porin family
MVKLANKSLISIYLLFFSFLFNQEIYLNKIDIVGLITATDNQIFRNTGLYPSEIFTDENYNGLYDNTEKFVDENYNGIFDLGTIISNEGMQVDFERFSSAIKSLWRLNVFSDVQIFITNTYANSIDLKIVVKELPVINEIKFEGCKKIKESRLLEKINLTKMQRVSYNDIYESKNIIKDEYIDENFHNVKIEYEIINLENDYSQDLVFKIIEGNKYKIKNINFNGNDSFLKSKLLDSFSNTKERRWYKFWQGDYNVSDFETDIQNLELFYKNNGYRDVQIISKNIDFSDNDITINIDINESGLSYYRDFNFKGNTKYSKEDLLSNLGLSRNQKYSQEAFIAAVGNLRTKYMDDGYFFMELDYEITPDKENNLDIVFNIVENQKTRIRKIVISGNNKTQDNVIRREMRVYPGDIFNSENIYTSLNSIFILNYFENVIPEITTVKGSENQVDINLSVIEKETGRANFSMGYNEVQGLTGGGGFEFSNFRGKGQMLSINYNRGLQNQTQGQSSTSNSGRDYQSFSFSFREPRIYNSRNSIGFTISHSEQGTGSNSLLKYDTISDRISIMFGRRFDWPDYYFKGNWTLSIRKTDYKGLLSNLTNDFSEDIIVTENENNGYASRQGISITQIISRDSRNRPEFTTQGSKFIWTSTFSGNILGGNENYHKQVFSFDWYNPVYKKIVMFQNFKFGALMELDDNQFIPYNARFVMGGTGIPYGEMLRGYVDNGVGPKKINSGYLSSDGGKIMFKYSLEFRYQFSESPTIYGLVFGDAGNVWEDFDSVDVFDLKRSLGLGVRVYMPMLGLLGYDVGYGFDNIYEDSNTPAGWEHHLLFGMPMN